MKIEIWESSYIAKKANLFCYRSDNIQYNSNSKNKQLNNDFYHVLLAECYKINLI